MDVYEELKFLGKFTKKSGGGVRWGSGWWGVRLGVNAMLGVGGYMGYGGCEPRIEGIVHCTKKVLYNIKKIKKKWEEGEGQYLNPKHSLCI